MYEIGELRRSRAVTKEVVWTNFWNTLKKVGKWCKALVPLIVAHVGQFGALIPMRTMRHEHNGRPTEVEDQIAQPRWFQ
jgi:hypothetical protein